MIRLTSPTYSKPPGFPFFLLSFYLGKRLNWQLNAEASIEILESVTNTWWGGTDGFLEREEEKKKGRRKEIERRDFAVRSSKVRRLLMIDSSSWYAEALDLIGEPARKETAPKRFASLRSHIASYHQRVTRPLRRRSSFGRNTRR